MRNKKLLLAASIAASLFLGSSASAEIVYDNTASPVNPPNGLATGDAPAVGSTTYEIGDAITLGGTGRTLTDWALEYYVAGGGNETGHAFLRANDGAGGIPGTVLYDSGVFTLNQGKNSITFGNLGSQNIVLPGSFTWSLQFGGIDVGETSGLLFYNGPEVGTSADNYWRNTSGTWELVGTAANLDNFGAQFTAVPEPSTWALLTGGLGLFGFLARRRKA